MRSLIVLFVATLLAPGCGGAPEKDASSEQLGPCRGDVPGCFKRAQELMKTTPFNCDPSVPLLAQACESGHSEACFALGEINQLRVVSEPSAETALKSFTKACDLGNENGCLSTSLLLLSQNQKERMEKGVSMLETGCGRNQADSCSNLAFLGADIQAFLGRSVNISESAEKAKSLHEAKCEQSHGKSCRGAGEIWARGLGRKKDLKKAAEYFEKGCRLQDAESCALLGYLLENGRGVHPDIENAELMYRRSCDMSDPTGCASLGIFLRDRGKLDEALEYYKKSCESWGGLGCYELAVAYETGSGVPADKSTAFDYYLKSCNFRYPGGCNNLGRMYQGGEGAGRNFEKALELYSKVCDGFGWGRDRTTLEISANACNNAGTVYSQGLGVEPNIGIALKYFRKGCSGGDPAACINEKTLQKELNAVSRFDAAKLCLQGDAKSCYDLGMMWGAGEDGPRDLKQARHWVKIACDNGYKEACDILPSMRETE